MSEIEHSAPKDETPISVSSSVYARLIGLVQLYPSRRLTHSELEGSESGLRTVTGCDASLIN